MHAGPQALFTGITALTGYGLQGWERDEVDVLLPQGARVLKCPVPLRVRRARDWSRVQRDLSRPIHARSHAVLCAAAGFRAWRPACGVLISSVQQRIVSLATLRSALVETPRLRHRQLLIQTLADIEQGSPALSEIDLVRLCRRYGLSPPHQNEVTLGDALLLRYPSVVLRRDPELVATQLAHALRIDIQSGASRRTNA